MSLRDDVLNANDSKIVKVDIDGWPPVYVRTMSGQELRKLATLEQAKKDDTLILLAFTVCDEAGNLLFTIEDMEALSKKNYTALVKLTYVAKHLNKLEEEDLAELKKTLEKTL